MQGTIEPSQVDDRSPARARLNVRDLVCWRGERQLFVPQSFDLSAGDILQIRGRNGSGKTTLLRALCGLTRPEQGQIRWDGEPIESDSTDYRANLIYVGHLDGVKLELSAAENLDFARTLQQRPRSTDTDTVLEQVGLRGYGDVMVRNLSAGQRRRVALARLLLAEAPLWLLDEPFTALDAQGEAVVAALLGNHLSNGGLVVFTSHQPIQLPSRDIIELELDP